MRALWSTLDASSNARDVGRFSALFSEQASVMFLDAVLTLDGRAAIRDHFAKQFSSQAPDLRHATKILSTYRLSPEVAAIDGQVEIARVPLGTGDQPVPLRRFAVFAVMKKASDGWCIDLLRVFPLSSGRVAVLDHSGHWPREEEPERVIRESRYSPLSTLSR